MRQIKRFICLIILLKEIYNLNQFRLFNDKLIQIEIKFSFSNVHRVNFITIEITMHNEYEKLGIINKCVINKDEVFKDSFIIFCYGDD